MKEQLDAIRNAHPDLVERPSTDWPAFDCPTGKILEVLESLKDQHDFDFLADITAIDHYETSPRYEVVYHLYSLQRHEYLRIATPCVDDQDPSCPSVVKLWPTADWHERECFDMFGIHFEGHPDLRRILMWDGYPFYPLRKEFPLAGKEVEFPSEDLTEATGTSVKPAPMMGGPFHSSQTGAMSEREPRADDESWTESSILPESGDSEASVPREFRKD